MRFVKFAAVFLFASFAQAAPPSTQPATQPTEPANISRHYELSANGFLYFDLQHRLRVLSEFADALQENYSLYTIKPHRLKMDWQKIFADAEADERAVGDLPAAADNQSTDAMATANLRFHDRLLKNVVAKLQDTHFDLGFNNPLGPIVMPIGISENEGKFYVTGIYEKLVAYSNLIGKTNVFSQISMGDEVIKLNGAPVETALLEQQSYISGSSPEWTRLAALRSLTQRNFSFPQNPWVFVELKKKNGTHLRLRMPWFSAPTERVDQARFFEKHGFYVLKDVTAVWNEKAKAFEVGKAGFVGAMAFRQEGLANIEGEKKYVGATTGSVALRSGYSILKGRTAAYLQVGSFMDYEVKTDGDSLPVKFLDVVRGEVAKAKVEEVPFIIDLTFNLGGHSELPSALFSIFAPDGKVYNGPTFALRPTDLLLQAKDSWFSEGIVPGTFSRISIADLRDVIEDSYRKNSELTPAISSDPIEADPEIKGYAGKIVALIGPVCISACDAFASLLKTHARATLLGTHTNGTGAGFIEDSNFTPAWVDSRKILRAKIPNHLFGQPAPAEIQSELIEGQAENLNLENRPTQADVVYARKMEDLFGGNESMRQAAMGILFPELRTDAPTSRPTSGPATAPTSGPTSRPTASATTIPVATQPLAHPTSAPSTAPATSRPSIPPTTVHQSTQPTTQP